MTMSTRMARRVSRTATGLLIVLLFGIPLAYVLLISFETPNQFILNPMSLSQGVALSNYSNAWTQGDLGTQLMNTVIYSVVAAAVSTALSLLIAYPIARRMIPGHRWIYISFVVGMCLPVPIIPLFIEALRLHLFDSRLGYIILHLEMGLPLGVLLLTAFVAGIPEELDHAAFLDGSSYLGYVVRIVLPLAWPSIVIVFLYSLLGVWNDIIGPVVFLASGDLFPVTRGVYQFYGSNTSAWTIMSAAIVIVSLPVMALFIVSQRQLMKSTLGASM
jgi:raffinose/stachyose/melibiose transport system permease protein